MLVVGSLGRKTEFRCCMWIQQQSVLSVIA